MRNIHRILAIACAVATLATPAFAHPGHTFSGLAAGLAHPFLGMDHLLAMVAVGVFAASQPTGREYVPPLMFIAFLTVGAIFGYMGASLPFQEHGILASVVLLGLLVAGKGVVPVWAALVSIGAFALLHGFAHGNEATGAVPLYVAGFVAASMVLHMIGFGVGRVARTFKHGLSLTGLAIAAAGLVLVGA